MVVSSADFCWWVDHFIWTYDPEDLSLTTKPFVLFPRQRELATWFAWIVAERHEGVLEKGRKVGASWMMGMYALHKWLFVPGYRTTFGSYKQEKVDRIGDYDSLFEKIRVAIDMLPRWMLPAGFRGSEHDNYMRLLNPQNGNQIVGEVGANMGRGGRSTAFFLDEAAFLEHAGASFRAISENSEAKVFASTANGMANAFYQKREATIIRDPQLVFRLHWRDDPRKSDAWAARRKAEMEPEDWASEHEIDYGASVERQLIPAEWVRACHDLWKQHRDRVREGVEQEITGETRCGLDLGAGKAEFSCATGTGPVLIAMKAWRDPDHVNAAGIARDEARSYGATEIRYDATGVGFSQGAILAQTEGAKVVGVNVGDTPPSWMRLKEGDKTILASDRFLNLKAFGWWILRERAKCSWEKINGKADHPYSECLLIAFEDSKLDAQLSQPTWSWNLKGKKQVDKAPEGAKSPDRGDGVVLVFLPVRSAGFSAGKLLGV